MKFINIGLDFGGNKSANTLVASGIGFDEKLYVIASEKQKATGVTPTQLNVFVYNFCLKIMKIGKIKSLYADSAEQTLINGVRTALRPIGVIVKNSLKKPINDRIHATTSLMAQERFKYIKEDCETLEQALCTAVYNDKQLTDTRLDNGTSDIDTLDAFEYSFEAHINHLIRSVN